MNRTIIPLVLSLLLVGYVGTPAQPAADTPAVSGSASPTIYVARDNKSPGRDLPWKEGMKVTDAIRLAGLDEFASHKKGKGQILHSDGTRAMFDFTQILKSPDANLVLEPGDRVYVALARIW